MAWAPRPLATTQNLRTTFIVSATYPDVSRETFSFGFWGTNYRRLPRDPDRDVGPAAHGNIAGVW